MTDFEQIRRDANAAVEEKLRTMTHAEMVAWAHEPRGAIVQPRSHPEVTLLTLSEALEALGGKTT